MIRLIKAILSPFVRGLARVFRPLTRRIDARLARILTQTVVAPLAEKIERSHATLRGDLHEAILECRREVISALYHKVDDVGDRVINRVWIKVDDVGDRVINRVWIKVDDTRDRLDVGPKFEAVARELRLLSVSHTPSTHVNVLMNSVVRELSRLHAEVEALRFEMSLGTSNSTEAGDETGNRVVFPHASEGRSLAG